MKIVGKIEEVEIDTEFIKLYQFLKWSGVVGSGVEAKVLIQEAQVKVNGEIELRRGKKLRSGDKVELSDQTFLIK